MNKHFEANQDIKSLANIFKKNSYSLYIVGGAVRDNALGRKTSDIDFATDATPEQMLSMFPHSIKTGLKHGTLTIPFKKQHYEVTTFRLDGSYSDSRHPDDVKFVQNLADDLSRRDFTINAMAADISTGEVIDIFSGLDDIQKRIIRTVGKPEVRFTEDALRMLRAIRFATVLNFHIEQKTFEAIIKLSETINAVSKERIQSEFFKIILSPFAERGILLLHKSSLLYQIFPLLERAFNFSHSGAKAKLNQDQHLSAHLITVLRYCVLNNANLHTRLAALFHDIAKPDTYKEENGIISFHFHEKVGAELTHQILKELKCSNQIIKDTCHLIELHMVNYTPEWSDKAIRKFILNLGKENLDDFLLLYRADLQDMSDKRILGYADEFIKRLEKIANEKSALSLKELEINGNDIMNIGYSGKEISKALTLAHNYVLEDPQRNHKEALIAYIKDNMEV